MEALGGIAQRYRLGLPGRAVEVAAAGTHYDGGTGGVLAQGQLAVQKVAFQGGFRVSGDGDLDPFHSLHLPFFF